MESLIQASPFYEIAALLVLAAIVGLVGQLLRQPMIVSFIAVGVLAGPSVLGVVQSHEHIDLLAELGVAILLFLVGLKLDLKLVRSVGNVALATGLGQVFFTAFIGFLLSLLLGLTPLTALYVAIALTFSSTIIIVKLLSDKREVDSLHGQIAIGFLIVQDIFVVMAMMALSAFGIGSGSENAAWQQIGEALIAGLGMLLFVMFFIRYCANRLTSRLAHSPELMMTFTIAWAALLAVVGDFFGFGKELGGLLAGISLASTPFREALIARLSSLRDFLLLFFFIALGSQLDLGLLGEQVWPAIALSLFVLIGNPLIVLAIMGYMGYRNRTGFLAGLTVAQISEFSLIFMAMGLELGHVGPDALGLVTLVGLITIALSVYMITYSHQIYRLCEPFLSIFERRNTYREETADPGVTSQDYDVIVFGLGRYGSYIAEHLHKQGNRLLAVDFNPDVVKRLKARGVEAMYGDCSDPELIAMLPLRGVKWVIAAMPQHDVGVTREDPRMVLIDGLKGQHYQGRIAVSTQFSHDVEALREHGADLVLLPYRDAAARAVECVRELSD